MNCIKFGILINIVFLVTFIGVSLALPSGNVQHGKVLFQRRCAACHGPQGKGDGPMGKLLVPPAADLTAPPTQKKSDGDLQEIIESGKPGTAMPPFKGQLSKQALSDLLAFIRQLSSEGASSKPSPQQSAPKLVEPSKAGQGFSIPFQPLALEDIPPGPEGEAIRFGHELIVNTQQHLKEYVGNRLVCRNCHLQAGRVPYSGPFVGIYAGLPVYRNRNAMMNTMEIRINDCMERSLNGRPLPYDSKPMRALVSYFAWMSTGIPVGAKIPERGFPRFTIDRPADRENGKNLYAAQCAPCHGEEGQGTATGPPVWGSDSYNVGAGMARVSLAAAFVKRNMPLGQGLSLTNEEAYDLAAFINSQPRPDFPDKIHDWPKGGKPKDSPY